MRVTEVASGTRDKLIRGGNKGGAGGSATKDSTKKPK